MNKSIFFLFALILVIGAVSVAGLNCGDDDDDDDDYTAPSDDDDSVDDDDSTDDDDDTTDDDDDTTDDDDDDTTDDDDDTTDFDLTFSGTGYSPHNGQLLEVAVIDDSDSSIVATDSTTVSGGEFNFVFAGILESGKSYTIDYYADFNDNEECDNPPTDHVWRDSFGPVDGDETVEVTHDTDFAEVDPCRSF